MRPDERRTARLVFDRQLRDGLVSESALAGPALRRALRGRWPRPQPLAIAQALALRTGVLSYERSCVARYARACRELGDALGGAPRALVRVDEYPHAQSLDRPERFGTEAFARFDELMAKHSVPYLISVNPWLSERYLDPGERGGRPLGDEERDKLRELAGRGVEIGLHHLSHRTRDPRARHHSAVAGISAEQLRGELDRGIAELDLLGLDARVFVPPFNRFDAAHYDVIAERFAVVCGGPETVAQHGFAPSPCWRGEAVLLLSYPPLYGRARDVLKGLERLVARSVPVWAPVTIHWGWDQKRGWADLEALAALLSSVAAPWGDFLQAVEASR